MALARQLAAATIVPEITPVSILMPTRIFARQKALGIFRHEYIGHFLENDDGESVYHYH